MTAVRLMPTTDADELALAAERATIGGLMLDADAASTARGIVNADDFAQQRHAAAFAAAVAVADRGEPVAPLTVAAELERRGDVVDLNYLIDLAEAVVHGAGITVDATMVAEHAQRRRIIAAARAALEAAQDGRDVDALVQMLRPVVDASRTPRRHRRQSRHLDLQTLMVAKPPVMLVDGVLPQVGVGFVVGEPNAGKTTLAVDLAARVAMGQAWQGRGVQTGFVTYIANEDAFGVGQRLGVWSEQNAMAALHDAVDVFDDVPPIDTAEGAAELVDIVDEQTRIGRKPSMIVVDTLGASLLGNEDKTEVSGPTMRMLGRLARRVNACVVVLHHPRKAQPGAPDGWSTAMRGSGGWFAAADYCFNVKTAADGIELHCLKMRNGPRLEPIKLMLRRVDRPTGDRGVIVTARPDEPLQREDDPVDLAADRVVETIRRLGGRVQSKTSAVANTKGKRSNNLAAWDVLVNAGRIRQAGTARDRYYVLSDRDACVSVPPTPPGYRELGTAQFRPECEAVPGTTGNRSGTGNCHAPHQTDQTGADPRGGDA